MFYYKNIVVFSRVIIVKKKKKIGKNNERLKTKNRDYAEMIALTSAITKLVVLLNLQRRTGQQKTRRNPKRRHQLHR